MLGIDASVFCEREWRACCWSMIHPVGSARAWKIIVRDEIGRESGVEPHFQVSWMHASLHTRGKSDSRYDGEVIYGEL